MQNVNTWLFQAVWWFTGSLLIHVDVHICLLEYLGIAIFYAFLR